MSTAPNQIPPRLRRASDVDLTKAKPGCKWCNGTGTTGYRTAELPGEDGTPAAVRVRLVCKCVTRRGGVELDTLDKMALQMQQAIADGTFAKTLAADILGLPADVRERAVAQLRADMVNPDKSPEARAACEEALRLVEHPEPAATTAEA